jgi:hypothetical protein
MKKVSTTLIASPPTGMERDIERIRRRPHQEVLEQVISIADPAGLREFSSEICCATDVMRRLNLLYPTPLAEEDAAALGRLG